jgi:hypothetical protein
VPPFRRPGRHHLIRLLSGRFAKNKSRVGRIPHFFIERIDEPGDAFLGASIEMTP